MKLVVAEKGNAAENIARELGTAIKRDKVYNTGIFRFMRTGQEWVSIGLRGHILKVDFPVEMRWESGDGWYGVDSDGVIVPAQLPPTLEHPPFSDKRRPFTQDGVRVDAWKMASLPYLVWAPVLKSPAEKEIIRALKNLAKKADEIIIATDFDREGELIGSDAVSMIREVNQAAPIRRARYSSFTKAELEHAFSESNLVDVDNDLAAAGEARQYIDLIWGAVLTRYLTLAKSSGMGTSRSAGRVQTPTLALIARREQERLAFVPQDYWVVSGLGLAPSGEECKLRHSCARFDDEASARAAYDRAQAAGKGRVVEVKRKMRTGLIQTPFNTTSLQAAAAAEGLAPARTMRIAESLYMKGLISYPRVDNTVYPDSLNPAEIVEMLCAIPALEPYCRQLLAHQPLHPTRGKQQTTDHPPIYPTAPASQGSLKADEWKLYNLIARRFLATLSKPPVIEGTKVTIEVGPENFVASGDVVVDPGYRAIYPYGAKKDEELPQLKEGDEVVLSKLELEAKQTEPPARFSQGKLVQEMERLGIGTKSTRATIIERLYEVKYIKNDPIEPSRLGLCIIEALERYARYITTPDMTGELEDAMTEVSLGKAERDSVVVRSRTMLSGLLDGLIEHKDDLANAIGDAVSADAKVGICPKCGRDLLVKQSARTRSSFIGCAGWPDCDVTYPLPKGKITPQEEPCPVCGGSQVKVQPFRAKAYLTCLDPACQTNREPDICVGTCEACAREGREGLLMAHRSERTRKRFVRCTNYETCKTSYPLPQQGDLSATGQVCPICAAPLVVVKTSRGPWKFCINMQCSSNAKPAAKTSRSGKAAGKTTGKAVGKAAGKTAAKATTKAAGKTAATTSGRAAATSAGKTKAKPRKSPGGRDA